MACAATTFAQDGSNYWARLNKNHPEATIETILNSKPATAAVGAEVEATAGYRLNMIYDGQFRAVSAPNVKLMEALGMKHREIKGYRYELLFKYNGQEFWLPVQTDLVEQLQLELRKDEPVLLYTTVLQAQNAGAAHKALLVEDFRVNN